MTRPLRKEPPARPCCTGRNAEPAALKSALDQSELLRQAIASGQVSARQAVAHHGAGEYLTMKGETR